jgi:maltose alpha-D-glucosyltransferase/alpha-amylase
MHLAFGRAEAPDLRPEMPPEDDLHRLATQVRAEAEATRATMEGPTPDATVAATDGEAPGDDGTAAFDPVDWDAAFARLDALAAAASATPRIRLHGDYHLGQVLRADGEFYILDFEGEPARSLAERRARGYALRDVAGMLRSLEYAVLAAWQEHADGDPALAPWCDSLVAWCETLFRRAYLETADEAAFLLPAEVRDDLLWAYLFEKVCYEIRYEINHRPSWRWLPERGLRRLLDDATHVARV